MRRMALLSSIVVLGATGLSTPHWTLAVDSRGTDQWMAVGPQRAYIERDARLAAVDTLTGAVVWASRVATSGPPALAADALAVAGGDRTYFLNPTSGAVRATVSGAGFLAGSSSYVVEADRDSPSAVRGYDRNGVVKWTRHLDALDDLVSLGGNLIAAVTRTSYIFLDASSGKAVASASDVDDLVGSDGRYVWFTVADGGLKGLDLNTARTIAFHNAIQRGEVRVEHSTAVAVVNGRLTRIDMDRGTMTNLHIDGRWVGGPIDNTLLIARGDGLYLQRMTPGTRPVAVAKYTSDTGFTTSDRAIAYVGLRDGTLIVVDVAKQRLVRTVKTGCSFFEGVTASGATTIVHCDAGNTSRLLGFPRDLTPA